MGKQEQPKGRRYEGQERRKNWNAASESPVTPKELLDGVESWGQNTKDLTEKVDDLVQSRRLLITVVTAAVVLSTLAGIYSTILFHRVSSIQTDNHQLLQTVESVTNPKAVATQRRATSKIVGQIVSCIENHEDHARDARIVLLSSCP